jgi:glucose 1-dehydrogenase
LHSPLQSQRAIVTGASSGIGAAIARAFAAAGASVLVNYATHRQEADQLVEEIARSNGGRAIALQGDVSNPDYCRQMFDTAEREFGGVDILVSNAGIQCDAPFTDMTLTAWRKVMEVDLTGGFLCAQEAVRRFRKQGIDPARSVARGKIVFTNSVHQKIPWAGHANYAAAKGGLKLLMETIAQELAVEKIRVNAIAPGAIQTHINQAAWSTPEAKQKLLKLIPYGRVGVPEDIAKAAVWLTSDDADYVVGTTLFVDGGMTLYPGFEDGG